VVWVLATSDLGSITGALAAVSPAKVALVGFLILPGVGVKSWRWERLLRRLGFRVPPLKVVLVGIYGIALGFLSPGRVGEFTKIGFLRRETEISIPLAAGSVLADRVLDLLVFMLFLIVGFSYFVGGRTLAEALLLAAAACAVAVCMLAAAWRLRPRTLTAGLEGIMRPAALSSLLLFSLAAAGIHIGLSTLLAWELGLPLTFWEVGFAVALSSIVSLLPVTVMGIGTREVALIYALGLFGVDRSGAVSFSLLVFAVHLLVFLLVAAGGSVLLPPGEGRRMRDKAAAEALTKDGEDLN
jgi:uncharacterized membrane protein YbhN (UPF0104 family)